MLNTLLPIKTIEWFSELLGFRFQKLYLPATFFKTVLAESITTDGWLLLLLIIFIILILAALLLLKTQHRSYHTMQAHSG